MYRYEDAIKLLTDRFAEMERIYLSEEEFYVGLPYIMYGPEFVPYIMQQLRSKNTEELRRIFNFIEDMLENGDKGVDELIYIAVLESLFFEEDFRRLKPTIEHLFGELTIKEFNTFDF